MELKLIRGEFPKTLNHRAIELAVQSFVGEVDVQGDPIGFFNQTIQTIANAVMSGSGDFWMVEVGGDVMAYATGHRAVDIDNRLSYIVPQAWVAKHLRASGVAKGWWNEIREHARRALCAHILIVSARNPKAFTRWLGGSTTTYATLLKEDI